VVAGATDAAWSPDGERIAFDVGNDAYAAEANGSDRTLLVAGGRGSGPNLPAWSPDGRKLAYFMTPGTPAHFVAEVWTINSDGSGKRRLYRSACCVGFWAAPVWSPDGRQIAFSASSAGGTFVMNADGSRLHRVSTAWASQLAWRP
jgi:Tol biopolymer transport system component